MNKEEVLTQLSKYNGLDSYVKMEPVSVLNNTVLFGDKVVSKEAMATAASWTGIPKKFLINTCPAEVQAYLLDRFFKTTPDIPKVVFKENSILAFTDSRIQNIIPERVIDAIEKKMTIDKFDRVYTTNGNVEMYIVGDKQQHVVVGDAVQGGVYITFSPLAEFNPEITSFVYRLACSNGAVRASDIARIRMGDSGNPYEWITNNTSIMYESANSEVERFRQMREMKLNGNTAAMLNHMIAGLPKSLREFIINEVMNQKPETVYDMMNIVTYIASHNLQDPRMVFNAMGVYGEISDHMEVCETCHQVIENIQN